MPTANLALPTIPENTLQPGVPVNSALDTLDRAVAGLVTHNFTADANYTLTASQSSAAVLVFTDSPVVLTLGRDVIFPARFPSMYVINSTAQTLTLKKSEQAGITIAAGARKTIAAGATDVVDTGATFTGGNLTTALNEAKGADIASAATTDIGAALGNFVHVTGTVTITSLGTAPAGARRIVRFAGALVLTHNATSLILPTDANITTAANDCAMFVSEGSGNWRCVGYERASGSALVGVNSVNGLTGAVTAVTRGKHAVPIVAGAMRQSVTGGCAPLATIASAADQPDIQTLDFDPGTAEYAQFSIPMPKSWNEGTITAQFRWSHAATATNFGVVWAIQAVAVSSGDAIATAFGTPVLVTSTGGATNTLYISAETAAVTIAGTPITADTVFFRVYRVAADAADTLAVDARLHGVVLFITTDADNDL